MPPPTMLQTTSASGGTVKGTVVAQDTQRPIRFAQVLLQSVASMQSQSGGSGAFGGGFRGGSVSTRTDAEGSFVATDVLPGDYYVMAAASGYVSERALLQAKVAAGADPATLLSGIPMVHVEVGGESSTSVLLERGGAISGRAQWEDGSPAAGVSVMAVGSSPGLVNGASLPSVLQGIESAGGNSNYATSDDRGMFRIMGLATGDYLVRAQIQSPSQSNGGRAYVGSVIMIYSPGVFRRTEAMPLSVRAGDERSDVRMVIDLRGLHTVKGTLVSPNAGQTIASGRVTLTDASDSSLQLSGSVTANGEFSVRYVPPGNYTLQVSGASTQAYGYRGRDQSSTPSVLFKPLTTSLVVRDADLSGVALSLTPVQASP